MLFLYLANAAGLPRVREFSLRFFLPASFCHFRASLEATLLIGQNSPLRLGFVLPTFPSRLGAVITANLLGESERKRPRFITEEGGAIPL
jgi:hypothetical protein